MSKFNKKLPPLLIAGATIFLLGSAYKFVFGKKSKSSALDASSPASFQTTDGDLSAESSAPQPELSATVDAVASEPVELAASSDTVPANTDQAVTKID